MPNEPIPIFTTPPPTVGQSQPQKSSATKILELAKQYTPSPILKQLEALKQKVLPKLQPTALSWSAIIIAFIGLGIALVGGIITAAILTKLSK